MFIIGITGGSGSGKTSICIELQKLGYYIIDADKIAREIVEVGKPALGEISAFFGEHVLNTDGSLDRKALADIVFNSKEKLSELNQITHKYIIDTVNERIASCKNTMCIIDAPLLFESGLSDLCNVTLGITAAKNVRISRIMKRDNLTEVEACARIDAQTSIDDNLKRTNNIIDTGDNPDLLDLAHKIDLYIKGVMHENR